MYRVAFVYVPTRPGVFRWWCVRKCYRLRPEAEAYTLPVKIDRDHGRARQRLLVLCPERVNPGESHTPYELVRAYLHALPPEVKVERAAEMRMAA